MTLRIYYWDGIKIDWEQPRFPRYEAQLEHSTGRWRYIYFSAICPVLERYGSIPDLGQKEHVVFHFERLKFDLNDRCQDSAPMPRQTVYRPKKYAWTVPAKTKGGLSRSCELVVVYRHWMPE